MIGLFLELIEWTIKLTIILAYALVKLAAAIYRAIEAGIHNYRVARDPRATRESSQVIAVVVFVGILGVLALVGSLTGGSSSSTPGSTISARNAAASPGDTSPPSASPGPSTPSRPKVRLRVTPPSNVQFRGYDYISRDASVVLSGSVRPRVATITVERATFDDSGSGSGFSPYTKLHVRDGRLSLDVPLDAPTVAYRVVAHVHGYRRASKRLEFRHPRRRPTTAEAPSKPQPPADTTQGDCDPNYKGACLDPSASDYDCAGGTGDGPKYVQGPIEVVGDDHFELDRDGDGIACE